MADATRGPFQLITAPKRTGEETRVVTDPSLPTPTRPLLTWGTGSGHAAPNLQPPVLFQPPRLRRANPPSREGVPGDADRRSLFRTLIPKLIGLISAVASPFPTSGNRRGSKTLRGVN